jgi:hypothetical protein
MVSRAALSAAAFGGFGILIPNAGSQWISFISVREMSDGLRR